MAAGNEKASATTHGRTRFERASDCEMVVTRVFDAPVHIVFEAWSKPELFRQWWVPKSSGATLLSCEMDVRVGGGYRLEFQHPKVPQPLAFFGKYLEVAPNERIVWTNEESDDGAVTTVTFEPQGDRTLLVMRERHPTKEALDRSMEGMEDGMPETFEQLADFVEGRR